MKLQSIAIFCGSAEGNNDKYRELATQFGVACAQRNVTIYYGGGCTGIMGAVSSAAMSNGGNVIGIAPKLFVDMGVLADNISEMILVESMSERKQLFETYSDTFVILPGSIGTMDEFFEVLTDAQLKLHNKPIVLLNTFGYYDALITQINTFVKEGFLQKECMNLFCVVNSIEEVFEKIFV